MSKYIIRQLNSLKNGLVNPREEWVEKNRSLLFSQISNTLPEKDFSVHAKTSIFKQIFLVISAAFDVKMFRMVFKPALFVLVIAIVLPSFWIATGFAAYDALPGDTLYGAKIVAEQTHLAYASFVGDAGKEIQLHMEFANRRANEVRRVINDPLKKDQAQQTVLNLKMELDGANQKLSQIKQSSTQERLTVQIAKDVQKNSGTIKQALQEVKESLQVSSSTVDKNLSQEVVSAKSLVKDTDVHAVEVALVSHVANSNALTDQDITNLVDTSLLASKEEVSSSEKGVEQVKTIMAGVKKEIADNSKRMYDVLSTSTKELNLKIDSITKDTADAVEKSKAASLDVDKKLTEVKEFLNNGNLTEAVGKLKEVSDATKQVENISDATLQKAQTILPVVQVIKMKDRVPNAASSTIIFTSVSTSIVISVSTTGAVFSTTSLNSITIPLVTSSSPSSSRLVIPSSSANIKP